MIPQIKDFYQYFNPTSESLTPHNRKKLLSKLTNADAIPNWQRLHYYVSAEGFLRARSQRPQIFSHNQHSFVSFGEKNKKKKTIRRMFCTLLSHSHVHTYRRWLIRTETILKLTRYRNIDRFYTYFIDVHTHIRK